MIIMTVVWQVVVTPTHVTHMLSGRSVRRTFAFFKVGDSVRLDKGEVLHSGHVAQRTDGIVVEAAIDVKVKSVEEKTTGEIQVRASLDGKSIDFCCEADSLVSANGEVVVQLGVIQEKMWVQVEMGLPDVGTVNELQTKRVPKDSNRLDFKWKWNANVSKSSSTFNTLRANLASEEDSVHTSPTRPILVPAP